MIAYQKTPYLDEEIYAILHPILKKWFKSNFPEFSIPQKYGIIPIHNKENTLIFAPTGTGKTLTAFLSIINELTFLADANQLDDRVYCVYISPLKALSRDIKVNLKEPLTAIKKIAKEKQKQIKIRVATRTGDTPTSQRAAMLRRPPHILITTPETFAIVLTSPKFRNHLKKVQWCIVDEIHSIAASKRGVHLSLSLERLQNLCEFTRIGLSATVSPLDEIAKFLVGFEDPNTAMLRKCKIVDAQFSKKMDLKVLCPVEDLISTPHHIMHQKMYELINNLVQNHRTTLIFTNTRAATERVVHNLKENFPHQYTEKIGEGKSKSLIGAHHGSLSTTHRLRIESQLKNGELKCIVSSTSLELGIDIGYIDLVILLGSPKSVARALQRIGRSGHKLHDTAKGRIIVLDRDDLIECAVLLKEAIERKIDRIDIPKNALDVLAQQIYGMAIQSKQDIKELFMSVKRSYCYATLQREDFDSIISYLAGDYASLEDRNVYAKIWYDKETGTIGRRGSLARVIYMTNVGTIPDETYVTVKLGDEIIGKIDEGFLERLKRGDVFVLGGETYEFQYSRGMTAQVKTSSGRPPTVPSWVSEMLPLSFDLAMQIQKFRRLMLNKMSSNASKQEILVFIDSYLYVDKYGANSIYSYFNQQNKFSKVANDKILVIEHFKEEKQKHVVFHTLYGRRVNDVLSRALAFALSKMGQSDINLAISDNGFMLSYRGTAQIRKALGLLKEDKLDRIMNIALDKTEILKRRFRHCATRSLMILKNYHGRKKSVGKQQVSSLLLLKAVTRISRDFPILRETRREILQDFMDINNAALVIKNIEKGTIKVQEVFSDFPSPFAFNLVLQGYSDIFKIEDKTDFLRRMHQKVLNMIGNKEIERFSYSKIWQEAEEAKFREKKEKIVKIRAQISELTDIPNDAKEDLLDFTYNEKMSKKAFEYLIEVKDKIKSNWPEESRVFIMQKMKEFDKTAILKKQLNLAYRKTRFDPVFYKDLNDIIDGKREGFSKEFKDWLGTLFKGTVPYSWRTELVKFLTEAKDEI
ncbi:ATP-dependent helicase [Candidatus Woesearchaeota archaeon]|nr:ATP-dependent helicase [Candidatus Woesearchaeota archaeon]